MNNDNLSDKDRIIEVLKTVEDPELLLDVWFLGLIYSINIEDGAVDVEMTFTSPLCPYGPELVENIRSAIQQIGFETVNIKITFDPVWQPSDEVKAMLGMI